MTIFVRIFMRIFFQLNRAPGHIRWHKVFDARLARTQSEFDPGWLRWTILSKSDCRTGAASTTILLSGVQLIISPHPQCYPSRRIPGLALPASMTSCSANQSTHRASHLTSRDSRQRSFIQPSPQKGGRFVSSSHPTNIGSTTELAQTPSWRSHTRRTKLHLWIMQ